MKIIGSSNSGYIVEITNTEMSRITNGGKMPLSSDHVDLTAFCDILDKVRNLDKSRIQYAKERTQMMLESFEQVQNSINALLLFEKLGKPEDENF